MDEVDEFGELFAEFIRGSLAAESGKDPPFRTLVEAHLGVDTASLPIVSLEVPAWDQANLQFGLDALLSVEGRSSELVGIAGGQKRYMVLSLSDLINESHFHPGPVEYESVDVGPHATHPCMLYGLVLLKEVDASTVLLVRRGDVHGQPPGLQIEALASDPDRASALLDELRSAMLEHNVFRGQMISLQSTMWGQIGVAFHERPGVEREDVILPEDVLRDVERQTIGISRRAEALRAAGRHLKRGILLHGPPGTGKTRTVSWLATELADATVIVLSGGSLGAAGPVARLARDLAPSLVVLEDVDLVAEERTYVTGGGPVLFELLNELDGMANDADVAVLLTTNRPDLLEPALAARPGRVDLAVEVPLPDEAARRRLFELYAGELPLEVKDIDAVVERTAGVTASFFRELLRQAALEAAEGQSAVVRDEHVTRALDRLLDRSSAMTKILLGATRPAGLPATDPRGWLAAQQTELEG